MPLYEYECEACHGRFEVIQKFSDPPIDKCPTCGGRVRKLLSSPAIQFKGSGWYVTDYAKKGSTGAADSKEVKSEAGKAEPASPSGSTSSSSGSSESAPKGSQPKGS